MPLYGREEYCWQFLHELLSSSNVKKCLFVNRRQFVHFTTLWSLFGLIRENTVEDRQAERFCSLDLGNKNDSSIIVALTTSLVGEYLSKKGGVGFLAVNFGGRIYEYCGNYSYAKMCWIITGKIARICETRIF